jgi:hypothetical protein
MMTKHPSTRQARCFWFGTLTLLDHSVIKIKCMSLAEHSIQVEYDRPLPLNEKVLATFYVPDKGELLTLKAICQISLNILKSENLTFILLSILKISEPHRAMIRKHMENQG